MAEEMSVRERAEQAIREGGSAFVRVGNEVRHCLTLRDIPSEAELANANPEYAEVALQSIQAQMAALNAQLSAIQKSSASSQPDTGAKSAKESTKSASSSKASSADGATSSETSKS